MNWGTTEKAGALLWKLQGPSHHLGPSLLPPDFSLTPLNPCCPNPQHPTDNFLGHTPRISPLLTTTAAVPLGHPGLGSHTAPKTLLLEAAAIEPLADGVPVLRSHSRKATSKTPRTQVHRPPDLCPTSPASLLLFLKHARCASTLGPSISKTCLLTEARPRPGSPPPPAHGFPQHTLIYRWSPLLRGGPEFPLMVPNTAPGT